MRPLLDSERMAKLDRYTIEEVGLPGPVLMENAGRGVFEALKERFLPLLERGPTLVVCGTGNNGGDGYVIARYLMNAGFRVRTLLCATLGKVGGDARVHLDAYLASGGEVEEIGDGNVEKACALIEQSALVVDALFGTGLKREVTGVFVRLIEAMDEIDAPVVAVDLPSGVCADTGNILGSALHAQLTVTFGFAKKGHYLRPGASLCGEVVVVDIGIPKGLESRVSPDMYLVEARDYRGSFIRSSEAHKGNFGHLLVLAGGHGKMGAASLVALAALRSGVGLVTIAFPGGLMSEARLPMEVMTAPLGTGEFWLPEHLEVLAPLLERMDAIAIGPGMGTDEGPKGFVLGLFEKLGEREFPLPCVVDADALTILSQEVDWRALLGDEAVITPHPGEAARLLGVDNASVQRDRMASVKALSADWAGVSVLKGAGVLINDRTGVVSLVKDGNPGMATAGSGDLLTGIVGAFLARGLPAESAAPAACAIHAKAGDITAEELGREGMMAGDLPSRIAQVLKTLEVCA